MGSLVRVDIQQIVADLQSQLLSVNTPSRTAWTDMLGDSSGQALLEFIATATTFAIFANERSLQEGFPGTARLKSSLFAAMRIWGTRLSRKRPAQCTVTITKPADGQSYVIPAYSVFQSPQGTLFNRTPIVFNSSQVSLTGIVLYKGTVVKLSMAGTGSPLQTFISSDNNFTVSDLDVVVSIDGANIPVVTDGLWHYQSTLTPVPNANPIITPVPAVQDKTTNLGELELNFGNANFGSLPAANQTVSIIYATCAGSLDNNTGFNNSSITYDNYSTIVSTSGLSGGVDEQNPSTYQRVGPSLFAAFDRAVNPAEYNAVAASYPGVVDAKLSGQAHVAPNNYTFMNAIRTSLLTTLPWSATDKQNFVSWMSKRSMSNMNLYFVDPIAIPITIDISSFFNASADLSQGKTNVLNGITGATTPGVGWIGRTLYRTDITDAAKQADPSLLYSKLVSPATDIATSFNLTTVTTVESSGGTSTPNENLTYYLTGVSAYSPYATSIVPTSNSANGESLPITSSYTVSPSGNSNLTLSWDPIGGYAWIRIYVSRNGGAIGLLAQIPGTQNSYTDTWTAPNTSVTPPSVDGFGIFYPQITSITVNPQVASDRGMGVS